MGGLLTMIPSGVMALLKAVFLLILAFIVAAIVKSMVIKLLNKTRLKDMMLRASEGDSAQGMAGGVPPQGMPGQVPPQGYQTPPQGAPGQAPPQGAMYQNMGAPLENSKNAVEYIGKLAYLLTFLLFVPGIFSALGVEQVARPILSLLETVWGYLPNILAAVIVLLTGNLVAKLVRQLLQPLFAKVRVDKLQERAGIQVPESARLSSTLAYIVYVLIMIPVVIVALQVLNISAVSGPAIEMLRVIFAFIPSILVAIILIWVGVLIGKFAGQIVARLIAASGADAKIREAVGEKGAGFVFSKTAGLVVQVVLDIFFVVQGMNVLRLDVLSGVGAAVIAYMPNVLAAVLILIAAFLLAAAAEKAFEKHGLKSYAVIVRAAILVVAAFMVINQLGIATQIVNAAFILIVAAVAVAFAVSFGIGGREFAKNMLQKFEDKLSGK